MELGGCVAPPSGGLAGGVGSDRAPVGLQAQSGPGAGAPEAAAAVAVVEGSPRRLFLAEGHPGGLRTGLGTGSERFLGPATHEVRHTVAEGLEGVLEGSAGAPRLEVSEEVRAGPGGGRVRTRPDARPWVPRGPFISQGYRVRELSEASPREVFGSAPLEGVAVDHFLPHQRSGRWPRSPSADSEVAGEVAGAGGGGGCGRTGPAAGPNPAGTAWASGVSRGFWWSRGGGCEHLKQTCTLNSPSSPFMATEASSLTFNFSTARCGTTEQLFAAGRASPAAKNCAALGWLLQRVYGEP